MAKNVVKEVSKKSLNSTEKQAIAKLMKMHQPMLKELEKLKDQREKLEITLFDQIDKIGKFLKPYQDQIGLQKTLMSLTGQQPKAKLSRKKTTATKRSVKPKNTRSTKKSK